MSTKRVRVTKPSKIDVWKMTSSIRHWLFRIVGFTALLVGKMLLIGGINLAMLGASLDRAVIGALLLASGALILRGRMNGLHIYLLAFLITLVWSLWEVGLDRWALAARLAGPTILLILAARVMPPRLPRLRSWLPCPAGMGPAYKVFLSRFDASYSKVAPHAASAARQSGSRFRSTKGERVHRSIRASWH